MFVEVVIRGGQSCAVKECMYSDECVSSSAGRQYITDCNTVLHNLLLLLVKEDGDDYNMKKQRSGVEGF